VTKSVTAHSLPLWEGGFLFVPTNRKTEEVVKNLSHRKRSPLPKGEGFLILLAFFAV